MRILLVNTYVGPGAGGQERVALDLALGLREAGHNVVVLGPYSNSPDLLRRIAADVPLCEAPWRNLAPGRRESHLALFTNTLHLIRRHGIQIVSGHGRMFGVYGACKVSGVPLVWTLHGADPSPYESHLTVRRRAIRSASKLIARERLAHFVAVSDFTSGCFLRILGSEHLDRLITIPNGFSALPALLALPPPQRTGPLKIGFVGRLEQLKGIFDLPAIALELQRRGVTYTFLIFGNGSMEAELKARFHEAGVSPAAVRFMGYEADPSRIYSQFSVMLHLSPADWLPTTTLESLAAGRPVVAYNAGGLPEIVRHGETGLLCPVGAVNEIADCLIDLHSAPSRAQSMGEKGRQVAARRFSVERMTSDYLELFSRILQTQRSVDNVLSAL